MPRARLFLITPRTVDPETFPAVLESALKAGDVASLLVAPETASEAALQRIAEVLAPVAQTYDLAVMVKDDSRAAARAKADGVHITGDAAALAEACESLQPRQIVGAANLKTRDEAMAAGEAGADYIFFGMLDLPEQPEPHRKSLDFGAWWASVFEPPCVVLAGSDIESVAAAESSGAEFIAVRDAVWLHPDGPAAAIRRANALLDAGWTRRRGEPK